MPDLSFIKAEALYEEGKISEAWRIAEAGYTYFLDSNPELAGKFRILQVQTILARARVSYSSVLVLLADSPSQVFASCELRARREMLKAYAYDRLAEPLKSEESMKLAGQQCPSPSPLLTADLAKRRGLFVDEGSIAEADFLLALSIARQQHDSFREADTLLDLGTAAADQEHYDQSIEWGLASLAISNKEGFKLLRTKVEGNLGWATYKLGDLDKALTLFESAERSAKVLESGPDEILWLNDMGLVEERTGQLAEARVAYQRALVLAKQEEDKIQAIVALNKLAFVSIRTGEWAKAEDFARQALVLARDEQDRPLELEALLAQGLIASHNGDLKAAETLLTEVARAPDHDRQSLRWEAQRALADIYAKERNPNAAAGEYRVALETASRGAMQHSRSGAAVAVSGQLRPSLRQLSRISHPAGKGRTGAQSRG